MRVYSITLHNYRKFEHTEITFPEGIIGLIGHNGAGKSTIIEAMGWAIYGNKAARTKKEYIKRQNASIYEDCYVKLEFELGGEKYEVTRIMSKKNLTPDAHVKVNGMVVASSSEGSTRLLEKRLGMDVDSFFTSLIAKQKELNTLSSKTPGERKKSMLKMLKIDAIEDAIKKVREDKRARTERLEGMKSGLKDIDELEKEMEKLKDEREGSTCVLKKVQAEIDELEKRVMQLGEMRKRERKKLEEYTILEKKGSLLNERLENKKKQLDERKRDKQEMERKKARYNEIAHAESEYKTIKIEREEMEKLREAYVKKREIEKKLKVIQKEREKLDLAVKELEKKILEGEKYKKKWEELKVEETKLFEEKKETEGGIRIKYMQIKLNEERVGEWLENKAKIEKMGPDSSCPTCGRVLGEQHEEIVDSFERKIADERRKIAEKENEIASLKDTLINSEKKRKNVEEEYEKIGGIIEGLRDSEKDINHYVESKKEKKKIEEEWEEELKKIGKIPFDELKYEEIKKKSEHLEKMQEEIFVLKSEVKKIPQLESNISEISSDIHLFSTQIKEIHKQIEQLDFNKERYESVDKEYEDKREQLQKKREDRIKKAGEFSQIEKEIARVQTEINNQKDQRKKIKEMRREIHNLEALAGDRDTGLLNDFKRYLISRIGPILSSYASNFFAIFTGGKYNDIEIDDNYEILIYDNGDKFTIERFSGGEEDLANLSLRLAISQLIAQRAGSVFQFIALDEIFGSQDIERRRNVLQALGELSHQFSQILLITHIEDVKDSLRHIINVFENGKGSSNVTIE